MNLELNGKTVLVTASSKGIGFAIASLFASEGCNVIISSSNLDNVTSAVQLLKDKYNTCIEGYVCNLNNSEEIEKVYKLVETKFGGIDILVNNCGGPTPGFFDSLAEKDWDYSFNQVLLSAVRFTKLVLPKMKQNKWGRVINITSISVKQPVDNLLLSNTFRSALTAFAKTISNETAVHNVTINNVAPGYTLTDRFNQLIKHRAETADVTYDEMLLKMSNDIPAKRFADPAEIANLVGFLASQGAAYITGSTINIDGGLTKATY